MARAASQAERRVLLIITGFVLIRLIAAACMGLGMDESYSTAVSRDLHLSYFDHPPMHQWLAHLGGEMFGYGRWTRLPFIALFAGSSWLMFRLAARLFGEAAGVWATLALNLSVFFSVAAGAWVLPDGPLIVCELAAALCLARLFFPRVGEGEQAWLWWPAVGLWLGLAALSKYQGATTPAHALALSGRRADPGDRFAGAGVERPAPMDILHLSGRARRAAPSDAPGPVDHGVGAGRAAAALDRRSAGLGGL
jgi:hypothetical protein